LKILHTTIHHQKKRRRRKKDEKRKEKNPTPTSDSIIEKKSEIELEEAAPTVSTVPTVSFGINQSFNLNEETNNEIEINKETNKQPFDVNKTIDEAILAEEQISAKMNENFIRVGTLNELRKPEKIKIINNRAIRPDNDLVYVQMASGFQAKNRADVNTHFAAKNESLEEKGRGEDEGYSNYGEGLVLFIRNLSRFSLGLIAAYSGVITGSLQQNGKIDLDDPSFSIGSIILSILCCLTGVGTLTFVDPAGRGGFRRLFQMDPASLINLSTLIAVLLSAVSDVLIGQAEEDANDENVIELNSGILTVLWLRFSMLLLAWAAFAFTEQPGGALYLRLREQNRISN
jgi:hypothetical protein